MIVCAAPRRVSHEDAVLIDEAMDKWSDAVLAKFREALDKSGMFEPGTTLSIQQFGIEPGYTTILFKTLGVRLVVCDRTDPSGNPITLAAGRPAYGYFQPSNMSITLPWLDGTNRLLPYVKKFAARHTLVHEAEHFLDHCAKSAYFPPPDKMETDRGTLAWWERETEFNAMWRQVVMSVRMLLRNIENDAKKTKPKMQRALVLKMFEAFENFPRFRSAIRESMLGKKTAMAIFEFGNTGHFQELASRCLDERNLYKYHGEFETRLRGLHKQVQEWFARYKNVPPAGNV